VFLWEKVTFQMARSWSWRKIETTYMKSDRFKYDRNVLFHRGLSRARDGDSGAPKNECPRHNSPPRLAEWPGAGPIFSGFPVPVPDPTRSPDGPPLKQVGRNRDPSRE